MLVVGAGLVVGEDFGRVEYGRRGTMVDFDTSLMVGEGFSGLGRVVGVGQWTMLVVGAGLVVGEDCGRVEDGRRGAMVDFDTSLMVGEGFGGLTRVLA
ncbi:hypothetical protein U1Q18_005080 [Sarracenia purpurea var. burkii]